MASLETHPPKSPGNVYTEQTEPSEMDAEELLTLLGDSYTQRVLAALGDDALTGREIIERSDISKATVYRRLDELQDAGIVDSSLRLDPNGHHCEQYHVVADSLTVSLEADGFDAAVTQPDESGRSTQLVTR